MAIERNPELTIMVKTHSHYSECEPWLKEIVGEWNIAWWRDFPDMAMIMDSPEPDCYWFKYEKDAVLFQLKWP
jgi:hypothetical protein